MTKSGTVGSIYDTHAASIYTADGRVVVKCGEQDAVTIADVSGRVIYTGRGSASIPLNPAVYIVSAGSTRAKVIVK